MTDKRREAIRILNEAQTKRMAGMALAHEVLACPYCHQHPCECRPLVQKWNEERTSDEADVSKEVDLGGSDDPKRPSALSNSGDDE